MTNERRPLTATFERFCDCLNQFEVAYVINTRVAGRPKDLADVTALETARET